jgi:hypothetical protein
MAPGADRQAAGPVLFPKTPLGEKKRLSSLDLLTNRPGFRFFELRQGFSQLSFL